MMARPYFGLDWAGVRLGRWRNYAGISYSHTAFSALTLLAGWQEGHPARKKMAAWWRCALVSPDGVAPSRMAGVSASFNLPLHHKVQKFSSGTGSSGWSRKKGRKTAVVWWFMQLYVWQCKSHKCMFHCQRHSVVQVGSTTVESGNRYSFTELAQHQPGLADLNRADFNHWLKWLKSKDFFCQKNHVI